MADQWVRCSERMPRKGYEYMVFTKGCWHDWMEYSYHSGWIHGWMDMTIERNQPLFWYPRPEVPEDITDEEWEAF